MADSQNGCKKSREICYSAFVMVYGSMSTNVFFSMFAFFWFFIYITDEHWNLARIGGFFMIFKLCNLCVTMYPDPAVVEAIYAR